MGYFNFSGFDSTKVLEYGIDDRDLHLISYIYAIQGSDNMEFINENGKVYFWLRNDKIIEDNPTLYAKTRTLNTMISKLCELELIEKIVRCQEKTTYKKSYYRITDKTRRMMFSKIEGDIQCDNNISTMETKCIQDTSKDEVMEKINKDLSTKKKPYGEFNNVLLTDEELDKLKDKFPRDYDIRIERISGYLESTGKKYKSHYATILNWARKDEANRKPVDYTTPYGWTGKSAYGVDKGEI